jgi:hypothetical protein
MVCRCYFVAFRVDLRLQSPKSIIFKNRACVPTTEQSTSTLDRILEKNPVWFREKSCMKCGLDKDQVYLEKNPVFLEKKSVSESIRIPHSEPCLPFALINSIFKSSLIILEVLKA